MKIPESMRDELSAWNNGAGIDLPSWVGCQGNFSLAVGYATIFWPEFVEFEGYILRQGFSERSLRGFNRDTVNTTSRCEGERLLERRYRIFAIRTGPTKSWPPAEATGSPPSSLGSFFRASTLNRSR